MKPQHTALALLALLALSAVTLSAQALEPDEIFRRVSPAVWTIKGDRGNNVFSVGSAVAVTSQAMVTACHVVDGASTVVASQGQASIKVSAIMRDPDTRRDLCVLMTEQKFPLPAVPIAPIAEVQVGQRVYAIGSPNGLEMTLSEGLVSALRPKTPGELPMVQTSAPISPGSSGGGLFDTEGRLVGVADYISTGGSNLGFAYPAQWVMELPQRVTAERAKWRELLASLGVVLAPGGEPSPSGHAVLGNEGALPAVGQAPPDQVRNAYKEFLLQSLPRAFIITGDGKFGTATNSAALIEHVNGCAARKVVCAVYAVDNTVVWGKQQAVGK